MTMKAPLVCEICLRSVDALFPEKLDFGRREGMVCFECKTPVSLDIDPTIDLTKPIYDQTSSAAHCARMESQARAYECIQRALEILDTLRRDPSFTGAIRVELEHSGLRVWYRRNERRLSHSFSWQALETSHNNELEMAIREVIRSMDFHESEAGVKAARKRQVIRT